MQCVTETKTEARGVAEAAHQASVTDTKASAELAVSRKHAHTPQCVTETKTDARGVAEAAHQARVTAAKASAELAASRKHAHNAVCD